MDRSWEGEFAEFYSARAPALRRTAFLLCGNWHEAEDLVQAALLKLCVRWRRVRDGGHEGYVRRVLVTTFISSRRPRRRGEIPTADLPEPVDPTDHQADDRLVLWAALDRLPPRQRAIVVLRYWEDQTITQTAEALGVAEGTVKSQTARALASLRGYVDGPWRRTEETSGAGSPRHERT